MGLCSSSPTSNTNRSKPSLSIPANFIPVISSAPIFKQVDDGTQLDHLACYFTHKTYPAGSIVVEQNSSDKVFYLIAKGTAVVYVSSTAGPGKETVLAELKESEYFGEISLVRDNTVTSASIRAGKEELSLLVLTQANWLQLDDQPWFRGCNQRLKLTANHRFSQKLKAINFLAQVPDSSLDVLGGLFRLKTYSKGAVILSEGDAALGFFVMVDGKVRVSVSNNDGSTKMLHPIEPESKSPYFGELSLLEKVQVTATITAEKDCLLLYLEPESFLTFLGIVPDSIKKNLKSTIRKRAKRALGSMVSDIIDPVHVGSGMELDYDD